MPKWSESSFLKTDLQMINLIQTLRSVFTTRKVFSHNNQQTITLYKLYEPRKFSCVSSLCVILMAESQPGKFSLVEDPERGNPVPIFLPLLFELPGLHEK